jgi:hypothetical protein
VWSRVRGLLLAAAVLAVAGVVIAAARSDGRHGLLDPRSTNQYGSHAAAELLKERGVSTHVVTTTRQAVDSAGPGATLVVANPESLSRRERTELRPAFQRGGRTVLLAPGPSSTSVLTPGVHTAAASSVRPTPPDCDLPAAKRAGDAELGGFRYSLPSSHADACYLRQGLPSLLRLPTGPGDRRGGAAARGDTVLLGAPNPLFNDRLDQHGNASLVLQLLGSRSHVVWYLPSSSESAPPQNKERGLFGLLPRGWSWGALQLAVAAVLAALWRMRRLGPLVSERLPVSVRASETTEGHARLYRRANARDRAADALRAATRTRLARLVGVPPAQAHTPDALSPAVAAHLPVDARLRTTEPTDSHAAGSTGIRSLLFGPVPASDGELVRLTDELDRLEREITTATSVSETSTDKDRTS